MKLGPLAKALGVSEEDYQAFKKAIENLRRSGRVVVGSRNLVSLPPISGRVVGTFKANPKGFGFVIPLEANAHGDLFIPPNAVGGAMTGDTVLARVAKKGKRGGAMRYTGEIVDVLERGRNRFVGTLEKGGEGWCVKPDGKGFAEPIAVDDVTAKGAKADDKVVVEIISYPTENYIARGVILEVLGKAGLYESEIRSVMRYYHLPEDFDEKCLAQARQAGQGFDAAGDGKRDDISDEVVITIDPPDAKDFDDAISLTKNQDGDWVLGVHIADVSSFVGLNSALDVEARDRGNSAYLPGRVIPMLPEILSNGVCSLQPRQKRFAKSAYITYDADGNILGSSFANSIICSNARLTYQEADEILKGKAAGFDGEVVALLKDMEQLAGVISKRRVKKGMLHLDLPETELILDDAGKVVDACPADDSYPHTIIEMFMVEANDAVAGLLDRFNVPFMRRIHPEPDSLSMKELSRFVRVCGMKLPRKLDRKAMQDLLAAVKDKPISFAINMYVLRSFERAEYSPLNIGHFALASTHYCHFTSPIRRYADLMVHRLLQCYLEQRLNQIGLEEVLPEVELSEVGKHISFTEQRADDAEGELKKVLLLQMLSDRIGEELDCVVSGITSFGVFVRSQKFGIEGLVNLKDLGVDEWKFDQRSQAVVGLHSGKRFGLGTAMKARIVSVNIPARQLDMVPAEPLVKSREETKRSSRKRNRKRS